jgi:regulator of replication initiation timing
MKNITMLEYLALIAENELLRIENEKLKRCPHITKKGVQCKNTNACPVHGVSRVLRE